MGRHGVRHLIAGIMAVAMTVTLGSCAQGSDQADGEQGNVDMGTVRVFVPSDGVTVSQETPVNKWGSFSQSLVKRLKDVGFASRDVRSSNSDDAADQEKDLADYVDSLAGDTRRHTIVVAPVEEADSATKRYGDLIDLTSASGTRESAQESRKTGSGASSSETSSADGTADGNNGDSDSSLASTLALARQRGIRVVLVRRQVEGFTPDVFVRTASAYDIGVLQATEMVSKLKLESASVDNPRRIEVLIPIGDDDAVGREAFKGVWSVLGKYFRDGRAVSPSKLLDETSGEDSWSKVAFQAGDGDAVTKELRSRLGLDKTGRKTQTRVDGVLAMNDFAAYQTGQVLGDAGYIGSSADINPEITLGGIVNNITGNEDLTRGKVPEPARSSDAKEDGDAGKSGSGASDEGGNTGATGSDDSRSGKADDAQWPIITGFGSYVSNIPMIVDGRQWMTGLEDRERLASDIAKVCGTYGTGQDDLIGQGRTAGFDGEDGESVKLGSVTIDGSKVPSVSRPLVAVTGSNLKKTVLDPGYVSAADAGL